MEISYFLHFPFPITFLPGSFQKQSWRDVGATY